MSKPMVCTNAEVRAILHREFPALDPRMIILTDDKYQPLSSDQALSFMDKLADSVQNLLVSWQSDRKDCGKFTFITTAFAQANHACVVGPDTGLAVGLFHYRQGGLDGHQICLVLTKVPHQDVMRVLLVEPQTGLEVHLTAAEKAAVELIYL